MLDEYLYFPCLVWNIIDLVFVVFNDKLLKFNQLVTFPVHNVQFLLNYEMENLVE